MELTHRFTVPAPVAETWAAFNDIESVAGCFPGATVTSVEGDEFAGTCKVKLGPISLVYSGTGTFTSKDESAGTFALEAKGKDKRGNGTAGAHVAATLSAAEAGATDVEVVTDLNITGKPAQFGRGVIQDVSDKLLNQFVACLEEKLRSPGSEGRAGAPAPEDAGRGAEAVTPAAAAASSQPLSGSPAPSSSGAPANGAPPGSASAAALASGGDDALDLGATVLPILAKTYWKQAIGLLLVLLLFRRLLRGR